MPDDRDEDDLPGLESDAQSAAVSGEPSSDPAVARPDWSNAELNDWFQDPFGGAEALDRRFQESLNLEPSDPNLDIHRALVAYSELLTNETMESSLWLTPGAWSDLGRETKAGFRRGWESRFGTDPATWPSAGVTLDSAPAISAGRRGGYQAAEELELTRSPFSGQIDYGEFGSEGRDRQEKPTPSVGLGTIIAGVVVLLGFGAIIGFFTLRDSGDSDPAADAPPPTTQPQPPTTIENTPAQTDEDPAGAVEEPDPAAMADIAESAFPDAWNMSATKTASIVPAPDFISATPVGAVLPWSVAVAESCSGETCTYASTVRPLIPETVFGEIPEAVWVVDGAQWTLDAIWLSIQTSFDGTLCLIEDHWTYEFTVTDAELVDGQSAATAFEGIWVQRNRLDLSASSGDLSLCGEPWELIDEWSVVGAAA